VDGVFRLSVIEGNRNPAGFMRRVNLEKTGIGGQRVKPMHGIPTEIVAADAAQNRGMVSQATGHDAEICRRAAQTRSLGQDVPKQFPNSKDQMRLSQGRTPSGVGRDCDV
jgi:hypothetical protein